MKITKDTMFMCDPVEFGEALRDYCFPVGHGIGGYTNNKLSMKFKSSTPEWLEKTYDKVFNMIDPAYVDGHKRMLNVFIDDIFFNAIHSIFV